MTAPILLLLLQKSYKYFPSFLNSSFFNLLNPLIVNIINNKIPTPISAYVILNLLTGINVKYFGLMYNLISYIYVIVAVLMIKTDFINRQIELMKLANEQEKVKAELEKEKEKEKKDKEEKENKPEKKEKKKEKKEKEKDEGQIDGTVNPSTIQESK